VEANLDDVESLKSAFDGAYGVYGVTNYWEMFDVPREIRQGKNIADAAKAKGVQHTVWSTLDPVSDLVKEANDKSFKPLKGGYIVPHFDGKAEIAKYFHKTKTPFTEFYTAYYLDNLLSSLQKIGDKQYGLAMNMEDAPLAVVAVDDIGRGALHVFKNRDKYLNKEFYIASDMLPVQQLTQILSKHLGYDIQYVKKSYDEMREMNFPGADDYANMFLFYVRYCEPRFKAKRDFRKCQELIPELESADSWIMKHKNELLESIDKQEKGTPAKME
jgi:hypothetical protein